MVDLESFMVITDKTSKIFECGTCSAGVSFIFRALILLGCFEVSLSFVGRQVKFLKNILEELPNGLCLV